MNPEDNFIFDDAQETAEAPPATLAALADAARQLQAAEADVAAAELALKGAKEDERKLREETIPGMFAELGIQQLKLEDGSTFAVKQEVYASIPEASRPAVFAWLTEHEFDGIIKTEVQVAFGKGELESAHELMDALAELGFTHGVLERSIHAQTLKAFLKERLNNPDDGHFPDLELFGARPAMVAKVTPPPKPRARRV